MRMYVRLLGTLWVAATFRTWPTDAAEMNGPMSSGKKADVSAGTGSGDAAGLRPGFDVEKLFANTCGWCHSDAGRAAGRGPKLMGTTLTDAEIVHRISVGKQGAMPAFGSAFSGEEMRAIVTYIRGLKPADAAK
jgi:mono/diheme cytochrome c family protein